MWVNNPLDYRSVNLGLVVDSRASGGRRSRPASAASNVTPRRGSAAFAVFAFQDGEGCVRVWPRRRVDRSIISIRMTAGPRAGPLRRRMLASMVRAAQEKRRS